MDRAEVLYARIMSKKSADDKRRSKIDKVQLTRFPISFTACVGLTVTGIIALIFAGLAVTEQITLMGALAGFLASSLLSYGGIFQMLSGLHTLAEKSTATANDPLARYVYTGRTDELGQLEYV